MISIGASVTGCELGCDLRRRENLRGAGVVEDLRHLARMQLVVDRHDTRIPPPRSRTSARRSPGGSRWRPRCARRAPSSPQRGRQPQCPVAQLTPTYAVGAHRDTPRRGRRSVAAAWSSSANRFRLPSRTHSEFSAKSDRYFVELQPPSTTIVCPLMKLRAVRTQERHRARDVVDLAQPRVRRHLGVDLAEPLVLQALSPPSASA